MEIPMKKNNIASIKHNIPWYLTGFVLLFGMKLFYSRADSDALLWILAPTARWTRILSGIPFFYEPHVGYVNHDYRFVIAHSCSGVQFMLIAAATLLFSFLHRMQNHKKKLCWLALSITASYLLTILVNGCRIVVAIFLPMLLAPSIMAGGWLNAQRLHTIIGIVIYFTALLLLYRIAERFTQGKNTCRRTADCASPFLRLCLPPLFWYLLILLGIPIFTKAYLHDIRQFAEYTGLLTGLCISILILLKLAAAAHRTYQHYRALRKK